MTKESLKQLGCYVCVFVLALLLFLLVYGISGDEVWAYGFAHSIKEGLIPYRDFNMVITPLYPLLWSIPLHLGDNLLVFHMMNSLMVVGIFHLLRKFDTNKAWLFLLVLITCYIFPTYNMLALFFLLLLLVLEKKEQKNEFLIGVVLGLLVMTKQSIGAFLLVPSIYLFFHKKCDIKKRIFGFLIPIGIFLLYFLGTNSLMTFLDDTVFGLFDFGTKNTCFYPVSILVVVGVLAFLYVWFYKKEKELSFLYSFCFLGMAYPLFDMQHVILAVLPLGFFLSSFYIKKESRLIPLCVLAALVTLVVRVPMLKVAEGSVFDSKLEHIFRYKFASPAFLQETHEMIAYLQNIEGRFFLLDESAYYLKIEAGFPLNEFDLINEGNMGYRGQERYQERIKDICSQEKCTFLFETNTTTKEQLGQTSLPLIEFVKNTYVYQEEIHKFSVYTNEK